MCLSLSVQLPQICRFYFAFRGPQGTASRQLRPGQRHRRVVVATHGDGDDSTMAAADPRVDLKLNARNAEKERKREGGPRRRLHKSAHKREERITSWPS